MFEWIRTKGVMKIYKMLRKKATCSLRVNTLYYFIIKAVIYGFYNKIFNLYTTIITELYAVFIPSELQRCDIQTRTLLTYYKPVSNEHYPRVSKNTKNSRTKALPPFH